VFNAAKTQLICFSQKPSTVNLDKVNLVFLDSALTFNSSVTHLGHILRSNLIDDDDIVAVTRDMCQKANSILHMFSCCDPVVKTNSGVFCLSLYRCGLWKISSPLVRSLEVAFNNILRRVWSLPRRYHMAWASYTRLLCC